jgi:hypothetical protein
MKTHVVYKYRVPGSDPDQDDKLKTEAISYEPEMVLKLLQAEGQALSLWSDYPDKYGGQPKAYKVIERYIEPGTKNRLNIIVTDPDSEQMPYGVEASPLSRTPAPPESQESNLSAFGKRDDINPPERENSTEHAWGELPESPEPSSEGPPDWGDVPLEPQEPSQPRSWLYRFFFGP